MEYNDQIKEQLELYYDKIESTIMPELNKHFVSFYQSYTELIGKLKNKGLLKDDPYLKVSEIIEITVLPKDIFNVSESAWKVAERVTLYGSVLSFITHNFNFSLNTFNFSELEKIKEFLLYYNWKSILNPSETDFNTSTFGKIAITFRNTNNDALVLKTFDNCIENIIKCVELILKKLGVILLYLKESYKQFIRIDILPIVRDKYSDKDDSKFLDFIVKEIKQNYSYLKLYKNYIDEVIKEEFSDEGEDLKKDILGKLSVTKKVERKVKEKVEDPNKNLITMLMELGKVRIHLSTSIDKLLINHNLLKTNNGSFISKLIQKISMYMFNITPKTIYQLRLKNTNGESKLLPLHFEKFYDEIKKLEFDLLDFAEEDKTNLFINNRDDLNRFIDRILMTIKKELTILNALDDFLKYELKLKNFKAKGIKPELTVIKTIINSSTAMYREYLDSK